jgi:hypothetical protein
MAGAAGIAPATNPSQLETKFFSVEFGFYFRIAAAFYLQKCAQWTACAPPR